MRFKLNGRAIEIDLDGEKPLLWVLREDLGLTGAKYGCGAGLCGACTVLVDGAAQRACVVPVGAVADAEITTIEGLTEGEQLSPVQHAWLAEQVPQCGYCQPGFIMAVTALLARTPDPSEQEIDAAITNICRCGTYPRIRRAIRRAAQTLAAS